MGKIFTNIMLGLGSLLACLFLAELGLRLAFAVRPNYEFEMWKYAVELKQPLPSPELPFAHYPNRTGHYYGAEITTNSRGFRDREFPLAKAPGKKRILFLGDSFTLGWGVPFDRLFSKQLEELLRNNPGGYEVINTGVGNYNSAMEVEAFKQRGLELQPDLVVLMYFANDMEPTPVVPTFGYSLLKRFYLPGFIRERIHQLQSWRPRSERDELLAYYRDIYRPEAEACRRNSAAIRELVQLCAARKIKLLIVNIPELRKLNDYPFGFVTEHIRALAAAGGVEFLDLHPALAPFPAASLWVSPEDPHMNGQANTLAAQAIYQKMLSEGMVN